MPSYIICQVISSGWVAYAKLYLVTAVEASLLKVTPNTFDPALLSPTFVHLVNDKLSFSFGRNFSFCLRFAKIIEYEKKMS